MIDDVMMMIDDDVTRTDRQLISQWYQSHRGLQDVSRGEGEGGRRERGAGSGERGGGEGEGQEETEEILREREEREGGKRERGGLLR